MDEPDEQLIRRALGRRPPPRPGPALADEVLLRVAAAPAAPVARAMRRGLAVATWLLTGAASVAVLARLPWSGGTRAVAWAAALALVPVAYSAVLWPGRFLGLLVSCAGPVLGGPWDEPWPDRHEPRRSA